MPEIMIGKVRPDLVNNLNENLLGKALDATQGNILNKKIDDILNLNPDFKGNPTIKGNKIATSKNINISSYLSNGWKVVGDCSFNLIISGNIAVVEGIITNDSISNYVNTDLPILPFDGKFHAGSATYLDGTSSYVVITPNGRIWFQNGHKSNVFCEILIFYPIN